MKTGRDLTTSNSHQEGLLFLFAKMEREAINMLSIASPYLDDISDSVNRIAAWTKQLKQFQTDPPGSTFDWSIPIDRPIQTKLSVGQYEPDRNGELSVYAKLSSIWQIRIPESVGKAHKKGTKQTHFELTGKASTRISIIANRGEKADEEVARWRFEVGNSDSPGCHFHSQILGDDEDPVFPKNIVSATSCPTFLFTPMDTLEFVLAELFQEDWSRHVAKETDPVRNWATCQKDRLLSVLDWQANVIRHTSGSPWTSLKSVKPDRKLLIGVK